MFIVTGTAVNPKPDFKDIIELLDPDELHKFCFQLDGLSCADAKKAERKANSDDPELKAREVLYLWHQRNGRQATRQVVLQAMEKCGFASAAEKLEEKWDSAGNLYMIPVIPGLRVCQSEVNLYLHSFPLQYGYNITKEMNYIKFSTFLDVNRPS